MAGLENNDQVSKYLFIVNLRADRTSSRTKGSNLSRCNPLNIRGSFCAIAHQSFKGEVRGVGDCDARCRRGVDVEVAHTRIWCVLDSESTVVLAGTNVMAV